MFPSHRTPPNPAANAGNIAAQASSKLTIEPMLRQLTVQNYALVEALDIAFSPGLTVITGESGAGKSIILGALGLVLGDRAQYDHVRPGAAKADVTAEFDVSSMPASLELLAEHDLADPDGPERCLIRRTVTADGRSRAFVNGTPVTLQALRALTDGLVDIHGQHEHVRLTARDVQLGLLDDFAGLTDPLQKTRDAFRAWHAALEHKEALAAEVAAREDRAALLDYQVTELTDANLSEDEFPALVAEHKRLSQAEVIQSQLAELLEYAAETPLHRLAGNIGGIDDEHPNLSGGQELLEGALTHLDEAVSELRGYADSFEADPGRLAELDNRMTVLHDLARKNQVPPEQLAAHAQALTAELDALGTDRAALEALDEEAARYETAFRKQAARISKARRKASGTFASSVTARLNELGIKDGKLDLEFEDAENERGLERVEFFVTTNPKYPAGTLANIASGGEQARIGLAIQVVAAEKSRLPCLVLDEADVGVGGTTADVIGRVLRTVAEHTQVLCVSHAPQVAALASTHLLVSKSDQQDTDITPLDEKDRVEELARMLAGADITDKSREYAETLLAEAGS